jgi:hypothetical protein
MLDRASDRFGEAHIRCRSEGHIREEPDRVRQSQVRQKDVIRRTQDPIILNVVVNNDYFEINFI